MNTTMKFNYKDFCKNDVLNIFSDASMAKYKGKGIGCYAVIAVVKNDIIDSCYRIVSDTTSNESEIKGVRMAISIANKYKYQFKTINIFSDSLYSINGLMNYIYKWKYKPRNNLLYTKDNEQTIEQIVNFL